MALEPPRYNGTCTSCRMGDVFDSVCSLCGAAFCAKCQLLRRPQSNLPDLNCGCRPRGWHEYKPPGEGPGTLTE